MKTKHPICFALAALSVAMPLQLPAQGTTTFISYLDLPSAGTLAIGSNAWLAVGFRTGTNEHGYHLDKIELLMGDAMGNPHGFMLALYDSFWLQPRNLLRPLHGSSSPTGAGTYAYSGPDIVLPARTMFFVVAWSQQPIFVGSYQWSYYDRPSVPGITGGWAYGPEIQSSNGVVWDRIPGIGGLQYAISATPIPEPASAALFILAGLVFVVRRHWALPARPVGRP